MRIEFPLWKTVLIAGASLAVVCACAVGGPGYDGYEGAGYVGGYYEPWGYDYGGWGRRYRVGPPRGGYGRDGGHGSPGGRPTHGGRPAPSIPGRPRR